MSPEPDYPEGLSPREIYEANVRVMSELHRDAIVRNWVTVAVIFGAAAIVVGTFYLGGALL